MILVSPERCLAGISSKVMDVQTGLFVNNQLCHSSGCWTGVAIKITWWLVVMAFFFFLVSLLCCESCWCAGEQCREYVFSQSGSEVLYAIAILHLCLPLAKTKTKNVHGVGHAECWHGLLCSGQWRGQLLSVACMQNSGMSGCRNHCLTTLGLHNPSLFISDALPCKSKNKKSSWCWACSNSRVIE